MANLFVPSKQIYAPELLVPGRKPVGFQSIDRNNAYGRHLIGGVAFAKMQRVDLFGNPLSYTNVSYDGGRMSFGGASYDSIDMGSRLPIVDEFTIILRYTKNETDYAGLLDSKRLALWGSELGLSASLRPSGGIQLKVKTSHIYLLNGPLSTGNTYDLAFRWKAGVTQGILIDGEEISYDLHSIASSYAPSSYAFLIGAYYDGYALSGEMDYIWIFNKSYNDRQIRTLHNDPYQVLKPVGPDWLTFDTGAAGSTSLIIAGNNHAHTVDSAPLTQAQLLSMSEITRAHSIDNIGLIQEQLLSIASIDRVHTADNSNVTTGISLDIPDIAHSHTEDLLALIQAQLLNITAIDHVHTVDNSNVTTGISLEITEVDHVHTVDLVPLTQAQLLSIMECARVHTVDSIDLGTQITLIISDILHAHLIDNCNLNDGSGVDTPIGRVVLINANNRIIAVASENRIFNVEH